MHTSSGILSSSSASPESEPISDNGESSHSEGGEDGGRFPAAKRVTVGVVEPEPAGVIILGAVQQDKQFVGDVLMENAPNAVTNRNR